MNGNWPHTVIARRRRAAGVIATFAVVMLGLLVVMAVPARADDTIKHPGDHPKYAFEAEPHLLLGWDDVYANDGFGVGARFSIPLVDNGFVSSINNSVAIGFGLDLLHYDSCWIGGNTDCSANYIHIPVVMQWNFFVAQRWSVFGEPGLVIFHGFIEDCPFNDGRCNGRPRVTSLEPALYLGGRYHFNDKMSLTMRIGFPSISVGVSFFP